MSRISCFKANSLLAPIKLNAKSLFRLVLGTLSLLTVIPLSAAPFVYAIYGDSVQASSMLTVIDSATNSVVTNIRLRDLDVSGDAVATDGQYVYVAGYNGVSVFNATTNTLKTTIAVNLGSTNSTYPHVIFLSPDRKQLYVGHSYAVASGNYQTDAIVVIDLATQTVVKTIALEETVKKVVVAPDGKQLYVSHNQEISRIDIITNTATPIVALDDSLLDMAITPDGKYLYGVISSGMVSVVDTTSNMVIATIPVTLPVGSPQKLVVSPDGKQLYVAGGGSFADFINKVSYLAIIDTKTNTVIGPAYKLGDSATVNDMVFTPDGKTLYISNNGAGPSNHVTVVTVFDTTTRTLISPEIRVGSILVWGADLAITPAPLYTPFEAFTVSQLRFDKHRESVSLLSRLTLGQGNSIDPLIESVALTIGNITTTIPAGSFHNFHHAYTFVGKVDPLWVEIFIKPLGGNRYIVQAEAYGVPLKDIVKPVKVTLTIGNDSGTATFNQCPL